MNLAIIETRDAGLVWEVSQNEGVREHVTDDKWGAESEATRAAGVKLLVHDRKNHVLAVCINGELGGCFLFDRKEGSTFEVHTMMLPNCRGLSAIAAGRMAMKWMQEHGATKLTSLCPMNHREILFFALRCGFRKVETIIGGWIKNGERFDLVRVEKLYT